MHTIIAGGTGLIGTALCESLLKQSHRVAVIGRSKEKIHRQFGNRVNALLWDELTEEQLQHAGCIINLTGAGVAEKRWSEERKKVILTSRIQATEKLVSLLINLGESAPALFNASAIGIYGLQPQEAFGLPPKLDEETELDFHHAPDFLAQVGRMWELATHKAVKHNVRVVNMRFGVVLSKKGGALPQMAMPFHFGMGGTVGSGQQPISWVTLHDVIRAIQFLQDNPALSGPVNIVSPGCVVQRIFAKTLGNVLRRPSLMPLPAFVVKAMFGEMGRELLLEGQHVYPKRLLNAGFQFDYPDIFSALSSIYEKNL